MPLHRRAAHLLQGLVLAAVVAAAPMGQAEAQESAAVKLFRVVTMRADVVLGLTPAELAALGSGPEVERIARRIAESGQLTAWRYVVARAADGSTRWATRERVAVLRQDALLVEPYTAALPVAPPPE
jgi:hypothetical protein